MALSTTQYGYIIDPMVPFTDGKGKTIKDGFVRVFVAGSSTPVITYRNFDGSANQDLIELDNSGRTKTSVIGSKSLTYKVCVYDQLHSQESPILTVDKVSVIGANITAGAGATVVTGLDGLTTKPDGFVDASVVGTDGYVALDHTLVTDDLNTDAKATAVENDRYIPLLNDDVNDPDSKITLGRLWQWVLGKIKSLPTTITAFRTGDVIPVDGPSGTAKMSKDDLLKETAEKALGSIHSLSDTATEADLVEGNYIALDGEGGTKRLPGNLLSGGGGDTGIVVFEVSYSESIADFVYPTYKEVKDAVSAGKMPVLLRYEHNSPVRHCFVFRWLSGGYAHFDNDIQYVEISSQNVVETGYINDKNLAADYNPTATYGVGDYCMWHNELFVCTTDISVAEEWNLSHWQSISISDIVGNVETLLAAL